MRRLYFFAYFLVLGLTACGGGGGSSSSSSSPSDSFPPQTAVTFTGPQTDASVSATNAGMLASNVVGVSGAATAGGPATVVSAQGSSDAAPQPTGAAGLAR